MRVAGRAGSAVARRKLLPLVDFISIPTHVMKTGFQYPDGSLQKFWYAIHVRSRFESQISTVLRSKGYEEFLPTYRCRHQWSDRAKELDLPLFPGYLFSRFDARERLSILKSPGVIGIVGLGKAPIPISDEEIEAIQAIVRSGLPAEPWTHLTVGSRVFIEAGPLAGLEGIVVNVDKKFRLVVSVRLLQRSIGVEIERSWVRPICEKPFVKSRPAGLADSGQRLCARAG
jgi:transcriptional antiterminator NusG